MHINVTTDNEDNHSCPSSAKVKYGYSYYFDSSYMLCEQGRYYLLQGMKHFIQNAMRYQYTLILLIPCIMYQTALK
jgi:hypothetical protein